MDNVLVLNEPPLEFAAGGKLEHPRDGLALFGPADSKGMGNPAKLSYGIIGTQNGVAAFADFVKAISRPVLTADYLNETQWPHFPGFEEVFHAVVPAEPAWAQELDTLALKNAATDRDDHKRVYEVVSLYLSALRTARTLEKSFGYVVIVAPDFVFTNCRPISRFQGGHGQRISRREQRLRSQMRDFFESYEPEHYGWSPDFRFQLKSRAMELGIAVQIVRESTLRLPRAERRVGGRQLTPLSDRAWNLCTALYYKSGGRPWKLADGGEGVCHVGVSFKDNDLGGTVWSAAQIFGNHGDGRIVAGSEGAWFSGRKGEYHLNEPAARQLLTAALDAYRDLQKPFSLARPAVLERGEGGRERAGVMEKSSKDKPRLEPGPGKPLSEIFLHTGSRLGDKELEGYQAACPAGAKLTVVRVTPERAGLRLLRPGGQPALRGTFWQLSPRRALLWTSGFKPRLGIYDGSEIPRPLCIEIQHGDTEIVRVARDILALTKLNYNGCNLGEYHPITTHFSATVGEILFSHRSLRYQPSFKYYV